MGSSPWSSPCRLSIAGRWAADSRDDSTLAVWLNIGAVLGFVIGAGCAACRCQRTDTPLSHGLVTAAGTYLTAQAVFVVLRWCRGLDVHWFAGVMFNLTGRARRRLIGGLLGQHLRTVASAADPVSPPAQARGTMPP